MGNPLETETLAQLYLSQGHPEKAVPIFERLLAKDPNHLSLREGLARCRAAMMAQGRNGSMGNENRLKVLQELLSRLTGERPAKPAAGKKFPSENLVPAPTPTLNYSERKLNLLRAMLQRLEAIRS